MDRTKTTAQAPAPGRSTVTRMKQGGPARPVAGSAIGLATPGDNRRSARSRPEIGRARDARRQLRPREERFAHLKRMYD